MALPATDNFNRASLGANWTQRRSFDGDVLIVTSTHAQGGFPDAQATWNADTFPDDQYAQAKLAAWGTVYAQWAGPVVRMTGSKPTSTDTRSFYAYEAYDGGGATEHRIRKLVSGTQTVIWSEATTAFANGDTLRLEVQGTTLRAYRNGSLVRTETDSSLTSGEAGVTAGADVGLDDFEAGALTAAGGQAPRSTHQFRMRRAA